MSRIFVYEFLSGNSGVPEDSPLLQDGIAMRDALVADLLHVPGVTVTCAGCRPTGCPPARLRSVTPHENETPFDFVHRQALEHDSCWIVAPETDDVLAGLHAAVGDARWIGCSAQAIRIASSKHATLLALRARGIATPLDFAEDHPGCWIVKPDDGAGAIDTRVHAGRASACMDLYKRICAGRRATLEPFVEGEALSISALVGPARTEAIAFNRQQLSVDRAGWMRDLGVRHDMIDARNDPRAERLHALARGVAHALPGLRGFVGMDLVWHAQRGPVVIEVNPRVTCAYVGLSGRLHRNLAADVLALHAMEAQDAASA
jgi:predicted ATP-grasp superfamily ATP-dependent carboligase